MHRVKRQYERFPYPPVPTLALPRRDQGQGLRYECAIALAETAGLPTITPADHTGLRILVAGAGTLEPLVVAQQHPHAKEIVAVDLSGRSLDRLKRRITWARGRDLLQLRGRALPPIHLIEADITQWSGGEFDYILASNMLHHTEDPARTLHHLVSMLKPGGVMRIVIYAKMSRFWINQTSAWLRWHGLSAETSRLQQQAREIINQLPHNHPIRSCFIAHSETVTVTGLVDAFFHSYERPLSPLQWQEASEAAGLQWLGETQSELAQGKLLLELWPQTQQLTAWQRLQLMDDLLELNTSPILWFYRRGPARDLPDISQEKDMSGAMPDITQPQWFLPSQIYWQLGQSLHCADALLHTIGSSIVPLLNVLHDEIGPRVDRNENVLSGLTMTEYPAEQLLTAPQPPSPTQWQELESRQGHYIQYRNEVVPGGGLSQQVEWLQLRYGYEQAHIGPLTIKESAVSQ